ncbi:hypothetical protein ACIBHX_25600 [Nonomuraea sp. NPDC050536]|uniref:hypothetical protein n=1 Tax=Nonomuraea sp. NPDC050536 TaxID=3364366 RepID=UPI0037C9EC41
MAATHELLRRLDPLVGNWEMVPAVDGEASGRGWTRFDWIEDGAFLRQTADADLSSAPPGWAANSPFPTISIIGVDDSFGNYRFLYSDARGVFRVYDMTLDEGVWTLRRGAPGFFQRFTATVEPTTITGRWERATDGTDWAYDFDIRYTKIT